MKLLKKTQNKLAPVSIIVMCTLCLMLYTSSSYSQSKKVGGTDVKNTKSSAIIDGINYKLHTVEKGQSLFNIAKFYNLTVNDIVLENPEAIDGIKPGEVLKILIEKKKPKLVNDSCVFVKIQAGQTLYGLSKQYGISIAQLKTTNPELNEGLKIGQKIKIPAEKKKNSTTSLSPKVVEPPVEKKPSSSSLKVVGTENTSQKEQGVIEIPKENPIEKIVNQPDEPLAFDYGGSKKLVYKIAFFLPFHVDEANAIDFDKLIKGDENLPNKTNVALQYVEGALLAIDSLKKQNINIKVFAYDIDEKDSVNIANTLKKPELATMDLMIGPLYGSSFMPIASFAKQHKIAIVSPFTQLNKILFSNPFVCKLSPSSSLQIERMASYVVDSFKTQNIILVNNISSKEAANVYTFKNTANEALLKAGLSINDSVKIAHEYANVKNLLSASKTNVVVVLSNNQSPVTDFISNLNVLGDKYKIVLFGLQNWLNYDNLDFDYLNKLSLHIPSNNFIDYDNVNTQNFIKNYRNKFKTEPEMYAYQGFDAAFYFLTLLQKEGSGFLKSLKENKHLGLETNYNFMQHPADSGFENKFVYILKLQDYKLMKAN